MLGFVLSDPFFCFDFDVCFWITVMLEDPNMAHCKISSSGCHGGMVSDLLSWKNEVAKCI